MAGLLGTGIAVSAQYAVAEYDAMMKSYYCSTERHVIFKPHADYDCTKDQSAGHDRRKK